MDHKELTNRIYKIAVLNDLIHSELINVDLSSIVNPQLVSKLRNMKKSSEVLNKYIDETFDKIEVQEAFGELCDIVDGFVNATLKQITK